MIFYNFNDSRQRCLSTGKLFEDPEFPPSDKLLMVKPKQSRGVVQWKRPKEICPKPLFVVDDFSRFDVKQGELGNCWFLAALETLTQNRQLFEKVVPLDNTLGKLYTGIFRFQFWRYGKWVEVVIDDRLPTVDGKLIYLKAPHSEFWPALLEKAYAKFYGSYQALHSGTSTEAMVDFSGGVIERLDLKLRPLNLFNILAKSKELGSLVTASIFEDNDEKRKRGLVGQHAYSVTNIEEITMTNNRRVQLLLIKNPWGNHVEWSGEFSDTSTVWKQISSQEQKRLKREIKDNGEFFMTLADFVVHFDRVELCHLCPDAMNLQDCSDRWIKSIYQDKWIEHEIDSPQIIVRLEDTDHGDKKNLCTIIVALMQKHQRYLQSEQQFIRFEIFKASSADVNRSFLESNFFTQDKLVGRHEFEPYREIVGRFRLSPGYYVIIPAVESAQRGEFMLRVFTEAGLYHNNTIVKVNRRDRTPVHMESAATLLNICDDHRPTAEIMPTQTRQETATVTAKPIILVLLVAVAVLIVYCLI